MKIDKGDTIGVLKKKLQKFSLKLWSRLSKEDEIIYVIDKIEYKIRIYE